VISNPDPEAFAAVVRQHQAMVFSLARHIIGDAAEAEEVAQEVFCKLFLHWGTLESDQHVLHWLRRCAARQAIDRWRRRKLRPRVGLEDAPEPSQPARPGDPWQEDRLRLAVATLPAEQRTAVVLRYQEGLEPREIAAVLAVPLATVKSRLQRGLERLRGAMPTEDNRTVNHAG